MLYLNIELSNRIVLIYDQFSQKDKNCTVEMTIVFRSMSCVVKEGQRFF